MTAFLGRKPWNEAEGSKAVGRGDFKCRHCGDVRVGIGIAKNAGAGLVNFRHRCFHTCSPFSRKHLSGFRFKYIGEIPRVARQKQNMEFHQRTTGVFQKGEL